MERLQMRELLFRTGPVLGALALAALWSMPDAAFAQAKPATKIVCWKDKSGKVIGCGDKVPPEYQDSATKELDARGVTRKTTESSEQAAQRRAREQEAAAVRAEQDRKALDQKRQDIALLETFSNEKEIDLKRDRELGILDLQIEQLNTALKSATTRYTAAEKNKAASPATKDELARATAEKERLEKAVVAKQSEKEDLRKRYAEYRRRYTELRSGSSGQSTPPSAKR
jgi:cell division protein FtsN